jgi:nucleoid-associated protein
MQITEATIHQLIKHAQTSGGGCVRINPRASALPIDQVLTTLCTDLLSLYTKTANSTGTLGQDPTLHTFPLRLREYVRGDMDFQEFTRAALSLVAKEMEEAIFANGGYAMFLRYQHANEDFVLICMLKLKPGAGIDEDTLSLQPTLSIDLNLLHEAARINLGRWNSGTEPYLSFIKGRAKKGDVTDYFRDALACLNFTSSSHHTTQLIKAADEFVMARSDLVTQEQKLDERSQMRQRLHDCFVANPDEVHLPTLAAAIMPSNLQDFIDYVRSGPQASQYQINDTFTPHKKTYGGLRRISGKIGGSISVGFDVADVREGRVYYDADRDGIVLKSPPAHIKQSILENAPASD